jgi:hypothetical protein
MSVERKVLYTESFVIYSFRTNRGGTPIHDGKNDTARQEDDQDNRSTDNADNDYICRPGAGCGKGIGYAGGGV